MAEETGLKLWGEVNVLSKVLGSSEFGRICQFLLALSFQLAGYKVSHFQYVGRPDFVAERKGESYSVEAKAPYSDKVIIKSEDLHGIVGLGHAPVIAVLTYPSLTTRWLILDAMKMQPKSYAKSDLSALSNTSVERLISVSFYKVLVKYRPMIQAGLPLSPHELLAKT